MRAILFLNTLVFIGMSAVAGTATTVSVETTATAIANSGSAVVDQSPSPSPLNNIMPSYDTVNSALNVVQRQTSQMAGGDIAQRIGQIGDQMGAIGAIANLGLDYDQYLVALANASPQQLQLIGDVMAMLGPDYAYDATQRESDLHRDCIAAAFDDLSKANEIVVGLGLGVGASAGRTDADADQYSRQMLRVKDYVWSAVQHLRDSCPLCRALKYAAGGDDPEKTLLPFVTVLCSSVLQTLHPFLTSSPTPAPASL